MPPIDKDQPLTASLLDRLLDDEPHSQKEAPRSNVQTLKQLKECVQRDLQNLLNTRWRCEVWPPDLKELNTSLVNYGIPDFTGISFSSENDQEALRKTIEEVIRRYEPRFIQVTVKMQDGVDPQDRTLRFRIDALLYAEPEPELVVFDSTVETTTGDVEVKGTDR